VASFPGNPILTPGWRVGAEDVVDDCEPFEEKVEQLMMRFHEQIAEGHKLNATIESKLKEFGYDE
jgi:type I restriction enzyme M protein